MKKNRMEDKKGRAKQAFGDLTDNRKLKNEGIIDRATSNVKERAEKVVDTVADEARKLNEKVYEERESRREERATRR